MLGIILAIFMGLVSVVASEFLSMAVLLNAPTSLNLTDRFFFAIVLPSVMIVVLVNALLLWKVLAKRTARTASIYCATYALAYVTLLTQFLNPPAHVATYVGIVVGSCLVVFGALYLLAWRRTTP